MKEKQLEEVAEKEETSLLEQIMSNTRMDPEQEEYSIAKKGLAEFISGM